MPIFYWLDFRLLKTTLARANFAVAAAGAIVEVDAG